MCCPDSDGDGYTNGEELGDPCCVWKKGGVPANVTGLSHPALSFSTPTNGKNPCVAQVCKAFNEGTPALRGAASQ